MAKTQITYSIVQTDAKFCVSINAPHCSESAQIIAINANYCNAKMYGRCMHRPECAIQQETCEAHETQNGEALNEVKRASAHRNGEAIKT